MSQPTPPITMPTVHMNGTGIKTLEATYTAAAHRLDDFIDAWGAVEFNARDYYPQGPEAWDAARTAREGMSLKIAELRRYLQTHREHLADVRR